MAVQLISYDLRKRGRNYDDLFEAITKLGKWWHCLDYIWIVNTERSCAEVREHLQQFIDDKDDLVVLGLNGNWASCGFSDECRDWFRSNL